MAEDTDLARFTGEDESAAQAAFGRMERRLRKFLQNYLRSYVSSPDDIDDLVVLVMEKLWKRRVGLELPCQAAWWAYVAKSARNAALDHLRQPENSRPRFELDERDNEMIEVAFRSGGDLERVLNAADQLWLEVDPELENVERNRRLLAAQLHFLHRRPWQEIVRLVSPHRPLTRVELDGWLASRSVRRELAFGHMYWSNDDLCRYILDAPEEPGCDLDALARRVYAGSAPTGRGSWKSEEILVILARYRNGLTADKIARLKPHFTVERVERVIARSEAKLPFLAAIGQLRTVFAPTEPRDDTVRSDGLWRRLVLQYIAVDDLPHKHILERIAPAAQSVEVKMNAGILNAWLSNGRIFGQLLRFMQRRAR